MKKEKIYTVTDQNNQIWEVKVFDNDDANVEVRLQGTDTWQDANWGIFTKNHGIDHDSLEKEAVDYCPVDYCPGCNVAYCHGRYTTGQCE